MTGPFAIETSKLVKSYPDRQTGKEKTILNCIDFRMRSGEFCSVVGPSGCGKSTLLRLVLGDEGPNAGTLSIFDRPAGPPDKRRSIVYQNYAIFPHLSVVRNVALGLELSQSTPLARRLFPWRHWTMRRRWTALAMEYLERMRMAEHADKYPHQLSGGQRQRVAIAQALITDPEVVLMDEPFSGLDPGTRDDLQVWLRELHAARKPTILFVTHDIDEAVYLGTRVIALSQQYTVGGERREGAKIVVDIRPPVDRSDRKAFADCREAILATGFNKERFAPVAEFLLDHPDAVRESA